MKGVLWQRRKMTTAPQDNHGLIFFDGIHTYVNPFWNLTISPQILDNFCGIEWTYKLT